LVRNSECFELLWINYDFRLLGHVEIILNHHFGWLVGGWSALCKPLEPLDLPDGMHALQVHLLNLNIAWILRIRIHILEQAERKLMDVEVPRFSLLNCIIINLVS